MTYSLLPGQLVNRDTSGGVTGKMRGQETPSEGNPCPVAGNLEGVPAPDDTAGSPASYRLPAPVKVVKVPL